MGDYVKNILAVDPGLCTGWAYRGTGHWRLDTAEAHHLQDGSLVIGDTEKAGVLAKELDQFLEMIKFGYVDVLVLERYEIQERTTKFSPQHHSLEIIGLLKYHANRAGVEVVMQLPVEAMTTVPDTRLKALGLYVAGADHKRDALRHLLLYAAKHRLFRLTNGQWKDA